MARDLNKVKRTLVSDKHLRYLKKKAYKRLTPKKLEKRKPLIEELDKQMEEINEKLHNVKRQLAYIFDKIESETNTNREFRDLKKSEAYQPTISRLEVEKVILKQQLLELQLKERDLLGIRTYDEIKEKRKREIKRKK